MQNFGGCPICLKFRAKDRKIRPGIIFHFFEGKLETSRCRRRGYLRGLLTAVALFPLTLRQPRLPGKRFLISRVAERAPVAPMPITLSAKLVVRISPQCCFFGRALPRRALQQRGLQHIAGSNYSSPPSSGPRPEKERRPRENRHQESRRPRRTEEILSPPPRRRNLRERLREPVKMFGNQTTYRGVLMTILSHLHEHLDQSIAYARMNGVIPPWSR
jgi:hypothetical protein